MVLTMPLCRKSITVTVTAADLRELFHRFLIQLSYLGCSGLWAGIIITALTRSLPAGVTAWLTTGIGMLFYQEANLRKAVKNAGTSVDYWRRMAMLTNVRLHIAGNLFVIVVIWWRIFFTEVELSYQDKLGLCFCAISLAATWLAAAVFSLDPAVVLFLCAVFSRVVEQGSVAFSPAVAKLPSVTVYGLLITASQIVANMSLERYNTLQTFKSSGGERAEVAHSAISWTLASAILNLCSALLIFGAWLPTR